MASRKYTSKARTIVTEGMGKTRHSGRFASHDTSGKCVHLCLRAKLQPSKDPALSATPTTRPCLLKRIASDSKQQTWDIFGMSSERSHQKHVRCLNKLYHFHIATIRCKAGTQFKSKLLKKCGCAAAKHTLEVQSMRISLALEQSC